MSRGHKHSGFTIVEALASVVLISLGIVASLQTFGALAKADAREGDIEEMQRLAFRKYDEIIAAGGLTANASSGDFQDIQEPRFNWRARQSATGTGNLDRITIEINYRTGANPRKEGISGLLCRPASKQGGPK